MSLRSNQTIIRTCREPLWRDRIHLHIYTRTIRDGTVVSIGEAQPLQFNSYKPDDAALATATMPTLDLSAEDALLLMDELWRVGIRPTEGAGSSGALAAMQKHLDDMRALVFKAEEKK